MNEAWDSGFILTTACLIVVVLAAIGWMRGR